MNRFCTTAMALGLLTACAETPRSTTLDPSPAAESTASAPPAPSGLLPTPYTAEQIRDANPPGTRLRFLLTTPDQPGMLQTFHWIGGDETMSVLESTVAPADGSAPGTTQVSESSWTELRDHAAFPAVATVRGDGPCHVGAGSFDCLTYAVTDTAVAPPVVNHFYFAKDRPGPPVLLYAEQDGREVFRMELIEDSR
jgi:hypothetical protein